MFLPLDMRILMASPTLFPNISPHFSIFSVFGTPDEVYHEVRNMYAICTQRGGGLHVFFWPGYKTMGQ